MCAKQLYFQLWQLRKGLRCFELNFGVFNAFIACLQEMRFKHNSGVCDGRATATRVWGQWGVCRVAPETPR